MHRTHAHLYSLAHRRLGVLLLWCCVVFSAASTSYAQNAQGGTSGWSVDAATDIFSSYLFRGQRLHSGIAVQPSIQPHYAMSETRSIDLLVWAHAPLNASSFVELDQAVAFNQRYSRATFSVGHQVYLYSGDDAPLENRAEVWGSMALDTMLNPVFAVYEDYTRYNLQYYEINLSHVFEKTGDGAFSLALFSSFGFVANGEELYEANGMVQITSGIGTEWKWRRVTVAPTLSYTAAADDRARNTVWGGLSFRYAL
jgi:hypothetical protein